MAKPAQRELFGGLPPFQAGSDTSYDAAVDVAPTQAAKRERVYAEIARAGAQGRTLDELVVRLGMLVQTAAPRVRELYLLGRVHKARVEGRELRRSTRSGATAAVWVVRHV